MPLPSVDLMHPPLVARPLHHEGWVYKERVDGFALLYERLTGQRADVEKSRLMLAKAKA